MVKIVSSSMSRTKFFLFALVFVLLAAAVVATLELTNTTHIFHKIPATKVIVKAGKPTPAPKKNVSGGSTAQKTPTSNSSRVISGATDTNGSTGASTSPNQWVVSQSGNITVKQPVANAKIQSGSVLSGSAKVGTVNFRLIDNNVGVISEGTLNVVNGNFSGVLNFTPHSTGGRLDVFSTNTQGVELNEVQISVGF